MNYGSLSQYFTGVAAKRLSAVEADPDRSNQHEFNGVNGLRQILGTDRLTDIRVRFVWLGAENEGFTEDSLVTWYDSRENNPTRSPEYRLYFRSNPVMEMVSAGDFLVVARRPSGELMIVVAAEGSTVENQLLWLFGIPAQEGLGFEVAEIGNSRDLQIDFAARFILDELQIEIEEPDAEYLDTLLDRYRGQFPTTADFSEFARDTVRDLSPADDPDGTLLLWLDQEERLFRRLERHIVSERLREGFVDDGRADVDSFIKFSLAVQNRRKSRRGLALENHLEQVFVARAISYSRGALTENNAKPDFLFPGSSEYRDAQFSASRLSMLGVKSTCKDRWRQVLSAAARIPNKHLFTLEPGISENQTAEMQANNLQLVLPRALHGTYRDHQQEWLMDLEDFLCHVRSREGAAAISVRL